MMIAGQKLSDELVWKMIESAVASCRAAGTNCSVAIVDGGGNLLAFFRMQGALLASLESSQVKAKTALYFGTETRNLPFDKPFTPALLGAVSYPIAFVPGGVPIRSDESLIGGIGVGGGTGDQDHASALAALSALANE